jgi:hypothetical protein
MARALSGGLLVVGEPLRRSPRAKADRSFQQRAFDEAAFAGALALVKSGENALHRPHPGAEIADRQADRGGRPVGLADHVIEGRLCSLQPLLRASCGSHLGQTRPFARNAPW